MQGQGRIQDFERGEALRILLRATHIYGVPPKIGNKLGVGGSGGALFIAIFDQLRLQSLPLMMSFLRSCNMERETEEYLTSSVT